MTNENIKNDKNNDIKLETIKKYLSLKNTPSALYGKRLNLIWCNDENFFRHYTDLFYRIEASEIPITKEKTFSFKVFDESIPFTLTPFIENDEIIFYICSVLKTGDIVNLMNKSEINKNVKDILAAQYSATSHIINVANAFELKLDYVTNEEKHQSVLKQIASASMIMTQINTLFLLLDDDEIKDNQEVCVTEFFSVLKEECAKELEKVGRKITGSREGGKSVVALSAKRFTIILMNIIQNALLYSPPASDIEFNLRFTSDSVVITVSNLISDPTQRVQPIQRSGIGLPMVKKAINEVEGSFKFTENENIATAELVIPLIKSPNNRTLSSKQKEYIFERFKPVHLFLNEIIQREK